MGDNHSRNEHLILHEILARKGGFMRFPLSTELLVVSVASIVILGLVSSFAILSFDRQVDASVRFIDDYADLITFQKVSEAYANSHSYELDVYDCENYSRDYAHIMGMLGYDVEVVAGHNGSGRGHAWNSVRLSFEPQSARVVDYSRKYPTYYSAAAVERLMRGD